MMMDSSVAGILMSLSSGAPNSDATESGSSAGKQETHAAAMYNNNVNVLEGLKCRRGAVTLSPALDLHELDCASNFDKSLLSKDKSQCSGEEIELVR